LKAKGKGNLPGTAPSEDRIKLGMSASGAERNLDHLVPMVVDIDGTLPRIDHWQQMSEIEKNVLRPIEKRNKSRLEALKAKIEDIKK
jgi:hypothetical protein